MFGNLTVITGPMFAGKTTRLIKESNKPNTIVFKPGMDIRYDKEKCVSHDGVSTRAIPVFGIDDIMIASDYDNIIFDEIQFFTSPHYKDDICETIRVLLNGEKHIMVFGLDMDWRGEAFEITSKLLSMADHVTKLKARCQICNSPAGKTYKKILGSCSIVELGSTETYEARCNEHWVVHNLTSM
jgi:thymidine kinase